MYIIYIIYFFIFDPKPYHNKNAENRCRPVIFAGSTKIPIRFVIARSLGRPHILQQVHLEGADPARRGLGVRHVGGHAVKPLVLAELVVEAWFEFE